jgi:large subunit ribosomal protein L10
MSVTAMTDLRHALRDKGVTFRVVKNRLTYLAADAAGKPQVREIVNGPTGLAVGFDDPSVPAKALNDFIVASRSPLTIKGGLMGDQALTAEEVGRLATLPSKDELIARLLGQLQAPITNLAYVLNAPIAGLARVLQRVAEAKSDDGPESDAAEE